MDKSKAEEIPCWKNWGKKSRPNEKRKSTILLKKEKNPWWKRLVLAELQAGVQIPNKEVAVKPKFVIHNVKNEVSFYLCKYQPWYKIISDRLKS